MSSVSPLPATPRSCTGPSPCAPPRRPGASPRRGRSPRRCSRRRSRRSRRGSAATVSSPPTSVSVAPWPRASSRRSGERSTQMIRSAPCRRQPATAPRPTMPAPNTTQVEPGSHLRRCRSRRRGRSRGRRRTGRPPSSGASGLDLRERDLRHHRVLGERRGAHEVADRLAVARQPSGAVREVALVLLLADRQAEVRARASGSARTRGTGARTA